MQIPKYDMVAPGPDEVDLDEGREWTDLTPFQRWYHRNKQQHKENVKERKSELAAWLEDLRTEFACERCGQAHPACLEFHHTEANEYDINLGMMARNGYSKATILAEIERGQVLCSNCHRITHYEEGSGPWTKPES